MEDTNKDKVEEKQPNQSNSKTVSTSITLGNILLIVLMMIIIVTGSLVYYMIQEDNKKNSQQIDSNQNVSN